MNAKAMSVIELYGILDPVTRDWTDGVLSNIFREMNKPTEKKERRYVYLALNKVNQYNSVSFLFIHLKCLLGMCCLMAMSMRCGSKI